MQALRQLVALRSFLSQNELHPPCPKNPECRAKFRFQHLVRPIKPCLIGTGYHLDAQDRRAHCGLSLTRFVIGIRNLAANATQTLPFPGLAFSRVSTDFGKVTCRPSSFTPLDQSPVGRQFGPGERNDLSLFSLPCRIIVAMRGRGRASVRTDEKTCIVTSHPVQGGSTGHTTRWTPFPHQAHINDIGDVEMFSLH